MKWNILIPVIIIVILLLPTGCSESVTGPVEDLEITMAFTPDSASCEWDPTEAMWLWAFDIQLSNPSAHRIDFHTTTLIWDKRECPTCSDSYEVSYDCGFIEFLFGSCSLNAGAGANSEFGFWSWNQGGRRFRMFLEGNTEDGRDVLAEATFIAESCWDETQIGTPNNKHAIRIRGWD